MTWDLKYHRARKRTLNLPWDDIERKYREGSSSCELSAEYQVAVTTILKELHRRGVEVRPRGSYTQGSQYTPELLARAKELRDQGMSRRKVAKILGVTDKTLGTKISGWERPSKVPKEEACRLYRLGATSVDLAEKYGVVPSTMIKYLRDWGMEIRGRGPHPRFDKKAVAPLKGLLETLQNFRATERGSAQSEKLDPQIQALKYVLSTVDGCTTQA